MKLINSVLFTILLAGLSPITWASDLAKEKRWADQIIDSLLDGEAITLNDGQHDFLAILTEAEDNTVGGAIILHGIGVHPDWPQVIHPLRVGLVEKGWTTLSLQLPILPNEAEQKDYLPIIPDAAPRIKAGIEYLRNMGLKRIAVIAHSMGTRMAGHALATDSMGVNSYIAIGTPQGASQHLNQIKLPILDLYGDNDLPGVIKSAPDRRAATSSNPTYQQIVGKDADHFFTDQDTQLVKTIADWLQRH